MNIRRYPSILVALILVFTLCPLPVMAVPADTYYFYGYGTKLADPHGRDNIAGQNYYTTNIVPTAEQLRDMRDKYVAAEKSAEAVIVGHSQGGLRALAYASTAFDRSLPGGGATRVRAVVTVGSPIAGHLTIENKDLTRKRFDRYRQRLFSGVVYGNPWVLGLGWGVPFTYAAERAAFEMFGQNTASVVLDNLTDKFLGAGGEPMLMDIAKGAPPASSAAVWDFDRNSDFHRTYIEGKASVPQPPLYKQVKDGIGTRRISRFPFIQFYQKYKTVMVEQAPKDVTIQRFTPDLFYANIVGTQHDLDRMLRENLGSDAEIAFAAINGYTALTCIFGTMDTSFATINAGLGVAALAGIFTAAAAPAFFSMAALWSAGAVIAFDGMSAMQNRNAEFGTILGSSNSDTFIQTADQYLPPENLGAKAMTTSMQKVVNGRATVAANHANEYDHPEIWGAGRQMGEPLQNYLEPGAPECVMKDIALFLKLNGVALSGGKTIEAAE